MECEQCHFVYHLQPMLINNVGHWDDGTQWQRDDGQVGENFSCLWHQTMVLPPGSRVPPHARSAEALYMGSSCILGVGTVSSAALVYIDGVVCKCCATLFSLEWTSRPQADRAIDKDRCVIEFSDACGQGLCRQSTSTQSAIQLLLTTEP